MLNKTNHKIALIRILKDIYSDPLLRTSLGFKGGTAAYLFYDLPRLSVDLDFDLINKEKKNEIFEKVKKLLSAHGEISEGIEKHFTLFFVLSYKKGERIIKLEISKRKTKSSYELKSYLGIPVLLMKKEDIFANKLLALLTRKKLASRDLFDLWFFLKNDWKINSKIIIENGNLSLKEAFVKTIAIVEKVKPSLLLHGLGELINESQKNWIKTDLKKELLFNLKLYLNN